MWVHVIIIQWAYIYTLIIHYSLILILLLYTYIILLFILLLIIFQSIRGMRISFQTAAFTILGESLSPKRAGAPDSSVNVK